ncbi:dynamin family protein [Alkalicoccus chagannorensis]|uniref:dynamin family protein n=1 Tax=Alkalicoccus chagannorensis TaxID=427072 RepID=UPI00041326EA|nr:dynamin family protein [Alkalicoccus chagannorensis]
MNVELTEQEQERLRRIEEKKESGTFEIAFCGHFSAGKSTLLNGILGAELLPTSPIPTSANIIRMMHGDFALNLYGAAGKKTASYEGELPWQKISEWGRDGADIKEIHIHAPLPLLSQGGVIADTPGVDSTDPTHAEVTMEQLYATDAIVYVMDYNHVQSETNLHFLKQLSESGKPVFIVINQIDKHDETEVDAATFRSDVDRIFESWHIRYADFYFTSMKEAEHPLNELTRLKQKLHGVMQQGAAFTAPAQAALYQGFYTALKQRLDEDQETTDQMIFDEAAAAGFSEEEVQDAGITAERLESLREFEQQLEDDYEEDMKHLYENVHLFPYTTTELLKAYTASLQSSFKTGFLFSGKKTRQEQEKRLEQLVTELNDNLKSQLLYYVEDYFRSLPQAELQDAASFDQRMQELPLLITADWLRERIPKGSSNHEYNYQLSRSINSEIVRDVRRRASAVLEAYIEAVRPEKEAQIKELETRAGQLEEVKQFQHRLRKSAEETKQKKEAVKTYKPRAGAVKPLDDLLREQEAAALDTSTDIWEGVSIIHEQQEAEQVEEAEAEEETAIMLDESAVPAFLTSVREAAAKLELPELFQAEKDNLLDAVENAEASTFTLSLFGAFSAGKSSFANALLEDNVMPTAPHPTTATVTRVTAPENGRPHGTVIIAFKSRTALSEEIASVARSFGADLDIDTIGKWNPESVKHVSRQQRTSVDYLKVMQASLRDKKEWMDTKKEVPHAEIDAYAADESTACMIEDVTIYYDARLTRAGIRLVDTPGVNSIHGRHTNVAFKQVEESDAIFYVTYYNHAFSKSDQYFLEQLSSINESFSADKMYFILNAKDLASDERELQDVQQHIHGQLRRLGYQAPRIFPVSSRGALTSPGDTSFETFRSYFYTTVAGELKLLNIRLVEEAWGKLASAADKLIEEQQEADTGRAAERKQLRQSQKEDMEQYAFPYIFRDAQRELEQLSLHLRKRMTFVLHDYFQETINVSTVQGSTRQELQKQLQAAVQDWAAAGEQFFRQEWEAVSIRLDYAVQRVLRRWCMEKESELHVAVRLPSLQVKPEAVWESGSLLEEPASFAKSVKSKKQFFEEGGKEKLKDALVEEAQKEVTRRTTMLEARTNEQLQNLMHERTEDVRRAFIQALDQQLLKIQTLTEPDEQKKAASDQQLLKKKPASPLLDKSEALHR